MFIDLFAHLECASNFDGNLYDKLSIVIISDHDKYKLAQTPASIGLHGAYYTIMFRPGMCAGFCVALTM